MIDQAPDDDYFRSATNIINKINNETIKLLEPVGKLIHDVCYGYLYCDISKREGCDGPLYRIILRVSSIL